MTRQEAIDILIAVAACTTGEFTCDNCPLSESCDKCPPYPWRGGQVVGAFELLAAERNNT